MSNLELFIPKDLPSLNLWMIEQKEYILKNFSTGETEKVKDSKGKEVEIPTFSEEGKIYAGLLANLFQYREIAYNLLVKNVRKNNWVVYLKNGNKIEGADYNGWAEYFWNEDTGFELEKDIYDIEVNVAGKIQHPELHYIRKRQGLRALQLRVKLVSEMELGGNGTLQVDNNLQHYIFTAVYDDCVVIKKMYVNGDVTITTKDTKLG